MILLLYCLVIVVLKKYLETKGILSVCSVAWGKGACPLNAHRKRTLRPLYDSYCLSTLLKSNG